MVRIMERVKNPKWDSLYDAQHKSFFSKFEEFLINNYFSKVFTRSILKASKYLGSISRAILKELQSAL